MYELLLGGIENVLQMKYLVPLAIGTLVGVVGGAMPGITNTMTVIMVLPFTFGLEPLQGLSAMIGVYIGGESGGLITSCLLGIPGKPSSIATMFDGFPMSRKGEPGRAIWLGIWASFFGGMLGGLFLVGTTEPLARIALAFGPWEYFALFVFALSMVAGLTGASLTKGLLAGAHRPGRHGDGQRPGDGAAAPDARHPLPRGRHSVPAGADRRVRLRADHVGAREDGRRAARPGGGRSIARRSSSSRTRR